MNKNLFYLLVGILIVFSCEKPAKKQKAEKAEKSIETNNENLDRSTNYSVVKCKNKPHVQYTYYIPEIKSNEKISSCVLFLDPHGDGELPVKKYQSIADEYQITLIGSLSSTNGQEYEEAMEIINTTINDIKNRLKVKNVTLCGFSGGGRKAVLAGAENANVSKIISCGAGVNPNINFKKYIDIICIVGNEDFNYLEVQQTNTNFRKKENLNFFKIEFNGGHEWPESSTMNLAFNRFYNLNTLIDNLSVYQNNIKLNQKNFDVYENILELINEPVNYETVLKKVAPDLDLEEYQKLLALKIDILEQEFQYQQDYTKLIGKNSIADWEKDIAEIRSNIQSKEFFESKMYVRILKYLSILSNMQATEALNKNNNQAATYFLNLYELVDTRNKDVYFLKALYFAKNNNTEKLLKNLSASIALGFNDLQRINEERSFDFIRNTAEFKEVIKEIN